MKGIKKNFTMVGQLLLDPCAGTFNIAKACITWLEHQCFIECETDQMCFTASVLASGGNVMEVC